VKNLIPNFIQTRFLEKQMHGHIRAYAMFIDLSGFTHLTQTLMKRGNVGAEQLSSILNDIFGPMVRLVYQRGGCIPYYAGDAFTAIFEEGKIDVEEFLETAKRLRARTNGEEIEFHGFKIRTKIGLSFGDIEWGIVGDENKTFYFRGEAINGSADAQKDAEQQQIVIDAAIAKMINNEKVELQPTAEPNFFLWENPDDFPSLPIPQEKIDFKADKKTFQRFLPKEVLKFDGRGEFRNVISVFISFKGVEDHKSLDVFTSIVLEQLNNFSGYFKEVDFGDKGGVMVGFFGAPVSFENNKERALEFVTALQENTADLVKNTDLRFRVGITSGTAYTGNIGSEERCQYAAVGTTVNLSARLMSYATWGEVSVDEELQNSRFFRFQDKGAISYKGFEEPISTYLLEGRSTTVQPAYDSEMIGREDEILSLMNLAGEVFSQRQPQATYVFGEAGIGKSRLTFELRERLKKQRSVLWMTCPADQILKKPFNPFITFFKNYFSQSTENSRERNANLFNAGFERLAKDTNRIEGKHADAVQRDLQRTRAVLSALLGLSAENDFWEKLDAQGRYRNILRTFSNFFIAEVHTAPLVIELEDGHWYDDSSKTFLGEFIRKIEGLPIFLLISSRYADDGTKPWVLSNEAFEVQNIAVNELDLNIFSQEAIRTFAEKQLNGKVSEASLALLQRTTNGNPFYLEQVLEYFVESNLLSQKNGFWNIKDENIKISGSINAVLTARIDRLSRLVKETVKAAAVIGREFEIPVLQEVLLLNEAFHERNGNTTTVLKEQIESAEKGQIWRAMNELRYIFKHSLLREAVYDMQLRARLRELHAHIAEAIEKVYQDSIEERYVDLAFHYEQAEMTDKMRFYFAEAAGYSRRNFQNEQALLYYDKLLGVLDQTSEKEEKIQALLSKGSVLELVGQWENCHEVYLEALKLTEEVNDDLLKGRTQDSLGHLLMLKGDYDAAALHLKRAAVDLEKLDDVRGLSKIYGNLGNLNFRQGEYEAAKSFFKRSIELSRLHEHTSVQSQIVANLGLTYMNQGDYDEGIRWQRDQLEICQKNGDKQGMATLYTNMGIVLLEKGDYDLALDCFENGLSLCEELGNKQLTSIAIGCMGSVYERKGDFERAMELFREDLKITEELGDKQGISIALGLIGDLLKLQGKFGEAKEFMEKNLELCTELGYQKGMAKAVNTLGDIFYNQKEYTESIKRYDQAIDISRGISNLLILGESLLEKGASLIALEKSKEAIPLIKEAREIAKELGNQELIFGAEILTAQVHIAKGKNDAARKILVDLLSQDLEDSEKAAVLYELHKISTSDIHRETALALYSTLHQETPQYLFQQRMKELEGE
jgi:predicted ATPase/class 3 adenylate cyclase